MAFCQPLKALCLLYDPLSPLPPSVSSITLCLLYAFCPLYGSLSPLRPPVLSRALRLFYSPQSHQWPSVPSAALCHLYESAFSTTLCLLHGPLLLYCPLPPPYGPLPLLRLSVPSTALCVTSTVPCLLYDPLSPLREMSFLTVSK